LIATTKARLSSLIYRKPIDSYSREFNYQAWAGSALEGLVKERYLTKGDCDKGRTRTANATIEAVDENDA
jgi:hypothetical protein